jgi:hypothetical protein
LYGFKNFSKSQEVISAALGGVPMKRMIGAVSDISHALKPGGATPGGPGGVGNASQLPSPSMDLFLHLPGGGIIVPQTELLKMHSGSLQVSFNRKK